ncbi:hypothetical protein QCN36_gp81 [Arthrobacter phage CastorTray]|uniref:Uncharacterized protein n=1 Tax=Arthrobacter phage CastorTray TaxID=2859632 RepID=A0AAE7WE16_9CAUD|nr:hypothetical protein QCN36_gp81 [Arthrobacter phage CastorTray]QYC55064.1 hypothetical protein SEA_CASTORTRAY_81 [Arthrobacter phage CastorTray]
MTEPDFHAILTEPIKDLSDGIDEQILAVFGSRENFETYKDLFVIEQLPTKFTTEEGPGPILITYRAETEVRIRPKTLAELEADEQYGQVRYPE